MNLYISWKQNKNFKFVGLTCGGAFAALSCVYAVHQRRTLSLYSSTWRSKMFYSLIWAKKTNILCTSCNQKPIRGIVTARVSLLIRENVINPKHNTSQSEHCCRSAFAESVLQSAHTIFKCLQRRRSLSLSLSAILLAAVSIQMRN